MGTLRPQRISTWRPVSRNDQQAAEPPRRQITDSGELGSEGPLKGGRTQNEGEWSLHWFC